jgi:putative transposase
VYNRGQNKENIFLDGHDYNQFLDRLQVTLNQLKLPGLQIRPLPKDSFNILAYCLMPNHFHLLIRQNTEIPITQIIRKAVTGYAKYFNTRHGKIGNVFQDTFKAKLVDNDAYLMYLSAYIHNNPEDPKKYKYSSFSEYLKTNTRKICDTKTILQYFDQDRLAYKKFVGSYNYQQHLKIMHLTLE